MNYDRFTSLRRGAFVGNGWKLCEGGGPKYVRKSKILNGFIKPWLGLKGATHPRFMDIF